MIDPIQALTSLSSNEERLDLLALGIDATHADGLLAFVKQSTPEVEHREKHGSLKPSEPVDEIVLRAIRALGQLEAVEATPAMLTLLERFPLDEYLGDEIERAWVAMGAGSLLLLGGALLERGAATEVPSFDVVRTRIQRITSALGRLADGEHARDTRSAAISLLRKALEHRTPRDISLISYAIRTLVGLQDEASAKDIREAFLRGDVDETICGTWNGIAHEMQLKGDLSEPIDEGEGKLRLRLHCTTCSAELAYRIPRVYLSPKPPTDPALEGWDGVMIPRIITCRACGALDRYKLVGGAFRSLLEHLEEIKSRGQERDDRPVVLAVSTLWDGTVVQRALQGLEHSRKLAAETTDGPRGAEAWRRLGNYCLTIELGGDEGENAWRKAVELDENEFEAAHQLAYRMVAHGDFSAAGPLLTRVMKLLPAATLDPRARWTYCAELMEMMQAIGQYTPVPLGIIVAFEAGTSRGKPMATLSSVDLRTFDRWDSLARFLHLGRIRAMRWAPELSTEPPARLLRALDTFDASLAPVGASTEGVGNEMPTEAAPRPTGGTGSQVSRKWQSTSKKKRR